MRNQNTRNFLDRAKEDLRIQPHTVDGFDFTCDRGAGEFDPHQRFPAEEAGFPVLDEHPTVAGFFYLTDAYKAYIDTLIEQKLEHPANDNHLPWVHFGGPDAPQHYSTRSLDPIEVEVALKEITL